MVQRFANSLTKPKKRRFRNRVLDNVRAASRETGVPWALMYDLSGLGRGEVMRIVEEDFRRLVQEEGILQDPYYLHHDGRPLVAVWGIGFKGREYTLSETRDLIQLLKRNSNVGGNSVMAGVPYWWRSQRGAATEDDQLKQLLSEVDIVSPWSVGRVRTPKEAREYGMQVLQPDLRWLRSRGVDYLPVIFPGFSWKNMSQTFGRRPDAQYNQIPRLGGRFLWTQAVAAKKAGAEMLYVAMFDEVDEGTAIFKVDPDPPAGETKFLDYEPYPPDHYLWLTGKVQQMLRGKTPPSNNLPQRREGREKR